MTMRDDIIRKRGYSGLIHGSELSLKIASYPESAHYLAERLSAKTKIVAELCCGVGVGLIEFSPHFSRVIGVDNDPQVIADAEANLLDAGVTNYSLIQGDIRDEETLKAVEADIVAYDIPFWSDYNELAATGSNPNLQDIINNLQKHISTDIVIYTPPRMTYEEANYLFDGCEYQQVYVNGQYDRNFIYLGKLVRKQGLTVAELITNNPAL